MVEGSEFEPAVPVYKLSDDSIMLQFATARRIALIAYECGTAIRSYMLPDGVMILGSFLC
jgi:hypothetical protein